MRARRRLFELSVVTATVAVLPVTVLVLWACGWYSATAAPREVDTRPHEREGIVWRLDIEPSAETLHVSSTRSGADAMAVALTPHTLILVGDKEGGVGDLRRGAPIRIVYRQREAELVALCVEFLNRADDASRSRGCRSNTLLGRLTPGSV